MLRRLGSSSKLIDASMLASIRLRVEQESGQQDAAAGSTRTGGNVVTVADMRWTDASEATVAGARIARAIRRAYLRRKKRRREDDSEADSGGTEPAVDMPATGDSSPDGREGRSSANPPVRSESP